MKVKQQQKKKKKEARALNLSTVQLHEHFKGNFVERKHIFFCGYLVLRSTQNMWKDSRVSQT